MRFPQKLTAGDWRRPSVIALILANLVPLGGVWFFGWEVFPLMFLFWSENVIVGVFNVLKMMVAGGGGALGQASKFFIIPFFCLHYGMFTFVHGVFVAGLFGGQFRQGAPFPNGELFWRITQDNHLGWAILGLAVSHGISFATNYLGKGEYQRITPGQLMGQPYGRIVVMHVAILGGGFLMLALRSPGLGLALLVILKTMLDLRGHLAERGNFSANDAVKVD